MPRTVTVSVTGLESYQQLVAFEMCVRANLAAAVTHGATPAEVLANVAAALDMLDANRAGGER